MDSVDFDNGVVQPELENLKNLDPSDRRKRLADFILNPDLTQSAIADIFGVCPATITADKKTAEFQKWRNRSLAELALDKLGEKLKSGDMRAIELVVSRLELLRPEDGAATTDNAALALLARAFGQDPEKEALKARVAELEEQVGRLNGGQYENRTGNEAGDIRDGSDRSQE